MKKLRNQFDNCSPSRSRSAFTLIEMLVAITIVIFLAGIILVTVGGVLGSAKESKTQVTLKKIHEILEQYRVEFNNAMAQTPPKRAQEPCLSIDADQNLKAILERKRLFREAFPQRWEDLFDINGNLTRLGQVATVKYGATSANLDNHELLYIILVEGTAYGTSLSDSDQFTAEEVKDTDGDGILEFLDAWDQPLRFYRWPTRLIRPGDPTTPSTPAAPDSLRTSLPAVTEVYWGILANANIDGTLLGQDSEDKTSALYRLVGGSIADVQAVEINASNTCTFHTPDTLTNFLVVSSGPDLTLGLFEPNDTTNFGHLAQPSVSVSEAADSVLNDNITNLQGID